MSPRPTPEIMNEYYTKSENYEIWNKFIFPKSEFNRREKICRPNLERIINECKKLNINEATFLEVGAGFGTFALLAKESKFFSSVEVVERTPYMSKECRAKGLNVIESAFEEVAQEIFKSVDVVACFEVIEHVFDPFDFLDPFYFLDPYDPFDFLTAPPFCCTFDFTDIVLDLLDFLDPFDFLLLFSCFTDAVLEPL